jgi:hypothetical protein
MTRAPIDTSDGRPTTGAELNVARQLIARSGIVERLAPFLDLEVGRPRHLSLEGFLVALQLNALHRHREGHLVEAARVLNAMTEEQRTSLGVLSWDPNESYDRLDRLFLRLCEVLEAKETDVDAEWFANQLARAAVPKDMLTSRSVAVDGTDVETWGGLKGMTLAVELDGEASETQLMEEDGSDATITVAPAAEEPTSKPSKGRGKSKNKNKTATPKGTHTARVLAIGPDGRKQYTADPDARSGHRSATSQRNAGPYVGYELHLAVQTRDVRWTNGIDRTTLGPEVPTVITTCNLVPAGSHRADSIVSALIDAKQSVHDIADVVWDPGYSLCKAETTGHRLTRAGIEQTVQLVTHQRGIRPFAGEAMLVDGQLYSKLLPTELRDLTVPPRYAPGPYRRAFEEKFNQRARWRYVRHAKPDTDGVTRWKCPVCAGLLRSREVPKSMRRSRRAPLVTVPDGQCCKGTLSAPAAELPLKQRISFGTTAWRTSMDRRQVVESANAALKGGFADLSRGFFRVFGRTKMSILLGFTVAAYNLDRIRSFRAKQEAEKAAPKRRAKRRKGTLGSLLDSAEKPVPASTGPPD